jgi:hypothetical protein
VITVVDKIMLLQSSSYAIINSVGRRRTSLADGMWDDGKLKGGSDTGKNDSKEPSDRHDSGLAANPSSPQLSISLHAARLWNHPDQSFLGGNKKFTYL